MVSSPGGNRELAVPLASSTFSRPPSFSVNCVGCGNANGVNTECKQSPLLNTRERASATLGYTEKLMQAKFAMTRLCTVPIILRRGASAEKNYKERMKALQTSSVHNLVGFPHAREKQHGAQ